MEHFSHIYSSQHDKEHFKQHRLYTSQMTYTNMSTCVKLQTVAYLDARNTQKVVSYQTLQRLGS